MGWNVRKRKTGGQAERECSGTSGRARSKVLELELCAGLSDAKSKSKRNPACELGGAGMDRGREQKVLWGQRAVQGGR